MRNTRRDFVKSLAALPLIRLEQGQPDVDSLQRARVDDVRGTARGDGRRHSRRPIPLAVGSDKKVLALTGKRTRRVDLGHRRVFPGFNDAHAHPGGSGLRALTDVACDKTSIEEIQIALRERAATTPDGHWVQGYLYDDGKTPRMLTLADLGTPRYPTIPSSSAIEAATRPM